MYGGARLVTPCTKHPLYVRVRCVPDAFGVLLTAYDGLKVIIRDRRVRFKLGARGCPLGTGARFEHLVTHLLHVW